LGESCYGKRFLSVFDNDLCIKIKGRVQLALSPLR
jgi:hypothetical protein